MRTETPQKGWWMEHNLRMIQCNLRETDAGMDPEKLVQTVRNFGANTLMVGAGGISAFYPTSLPFQRKNPYLTSDLLGTLLTLCHQNGIRLIARFDFSKAHESFLSKHPDWFYRTAQGDTVNFCGMVHTCVNGEYQQKLSLEILREALERYPADGVFFNMFGYQTRDYSERFHGICQCENCKSRYSALFHKPLPAREDDPDIESYRAFQRFTVQEMLGKIHGVIKSIRPDTAICTYADHKIDIIRSESNTALSRPLPLWPYSASDNTMTVRGSYPDKISANCAINAADIFWRFMGVSPQETKLRLLENMASGGGLDFCIIGVFEGYPDSAPIEAVREVFAFHQKHEKIFSRLTSRSEILLIKPAGEQAEYRGIFKALKEAHLPFDVVKESALGDRLPGSRCRLAIAPSVSFDPELLPENCSLIATGTAFSGQEEALQNLFGAVEKGETGDNRGAYLQTKDKAFWKRLPSREWVLLDGPFRRCSFAGETSLPYLPPARYGPPECCGGSEESGFYGLGIRRDGKRARALLPWEIGSLYYRHGFVEHRDILLDVIDSLGTFTAVKTDAPPMTELFYDSCPDGILIQLINHSGFNGLTFFDPLPIRDISLSVRLPAEQTGKITVTSLRDGTQIPCRITDGAVTFTVPELREYDAFLLAPPEKTSQKRGMTR